MPTTTIDFPRTCVGGRCRRTATYRVSWPSSIEGQPDHEKMLCPEHYDDQFGGRDLPNLKVEILTVADARTDV